MRLLGDVTAVHGHGMPGDEGGNAFLTPEPVPQFVDLNSPTPRGKIEIASPWGEADGHPRVLQPLADPPPTGNRLRLLTPATDWLMNDSLANAPRIVKEMGPASVDLHPDDAAALGLKEGDGARLSNDTGEVVLKVRLSEDIPAGVALAHKGRWPKRETSQANVNFLNPGKKTDMGESSAVHGVEVSIRAASDGRE